MSYVFVGGSVLSIAGGIFGSSAAKKKEREARRRRQMLEGKLAGLEANRQEIINPFEGVQDLSSLISNPFATLGVATKSAEIQIEESDIALASTLDTLRATGASAGGATALAQAALRSKKGVSASIEQQEASNEKLRAQGEATRQNQLRSEQQRLQQADVQGKQFVFQTREGREVAEMDRIASQISGSAMAEAQAGADSTSAITGMFGSLANLAGTRIGA
jgi:hypothetical protein